jgi:hypothetical protein
MGGKKTKAKAEKKKGPKGKKARAKAKLDRQWGETAIIDEANQTRRIGNSRLKAKEKKTAITWGKETQPNKTDRVTTGILKTRQTKENPYSRKQTRHGKKGSDSDDDDLNSVDSNDSETEGTALQDLLRTIQKSTKQKKKRRHEEEDLPAGVPNDMEESDESEMEEDEEDFEEVEDIRNQEDAGDEEENDDNDDIDSVGDADNEDSEKNSTQDLFRQRFGRKHVEQSESENNPTSHIIAVDESLELHVTHPEDSNTLDDLTSALEDANKRRDWEKLAEKSFAGNRMVLQRQWKRLHRQMSKEQAPIYSFLTRYTDMLVTTESLKVRSSRV